MGNKEFGQKLRELRKQAGLTQRELAEKIGVNYSYLSKIESQVMPPPSEQIIARLAEVLDVNREELLLLAGKIPADVAQLLKNQRVVQLLRSGKTLKEIGIAGKNEGISKMKKLFKLQKVARVALPVLLVIAVAASIFYAAPLPVRALTIDFPSLPSTGTLGSTYTFQVKVNIETQDLLPVHSIDLLIRSKTAPNTYKATVTGLPVPGTGLTSATKSFTSAQTGGGGVSATATTAYGWTWALGSPTQRSGYGYRDPTGLGYHYLGNTSGYGYGYNSNKGNTSITFSVTWNSPSSWPAGSYEIVTYVYGDAAKTKKWSGTSSSFSLSEAESPSPIGAPVTVEPGVTDVSSVVSSTGSFIQDVAIESADGKVDLTIDQGTVGKTKEGEPLSTITVQEIADPPAPPEDANIIGLAYNLGPDDATFEPPITLTFTYEPAEVPEGVAEEDLVVAFYDEASGEWVILEGAVVDPVTNSITVPVSHFSKFAIIARVVAAPEAPVTEPEAPVTEPEAPVTKPEEPVTKPEEPVTKPEAPVTKPEAPVTKPEAPVTKPEAPVEAPSASIAWWVWVIIAVVVIGLPAYFLWWRRRI